MEARCTANIISIDAWRLISHELSIKDLLALRSTCHRMNKIVCSLNARWYRAWQWFVIRKGSNSKARSAQKIHKRSLGINCFPYCYTFPNADGSSIRLTRYQQNFRVRAQSMIDAGKFIEADCKDRYHFVWKKPTTELDVPLDAKYNPRRNCYINWYLIECYRHYGPKHNNALSALEATIRQKKYQIAACERKIISAKKTIEQSKVKLAQQQQKYKDNSIFGGVRINTYKTVQPKPPKRKQDNKSNKSNKRPAKKKK